MQDIKAGLNESEVIKYREKYGENKLERSKKKSFFSLFISNFSDPIIRVLLIALFINTVFFTHR
jgi:Ca2+-transporting ATPase